jgi:MATE family multidrug resistance protein
VAIAYLAFPGVFVAAFSAKADPAAFEPIGRLVRVLLRFVALYTVFDTLNIVFASAIKGAGDTRFVMTVIVGVSIGLLVVPCFVALVVFKADIYVAWAIISGYIILLGGIFLARFLSGKWKSMRVIERAPHELPPTYPEAPATEYEL